MIEAVNEYFKWYFLKNEGWEGVWRKYYPSIQKLNLKDKKTWKKKLVKRFGPNVKRSLEQMLLYEDPMLARMKKCGWGESIRVPLEYGRPNTK